MRKALVTGGCGFLGSQIVKSLLRRGVAVRALALPKERPDNLDGLDVEIVRGDVRSPEDCSAAVAGCDTVFHAAAIYQAWAPDPSRMYEVNNRGTFHVMEASRREGVEKVIYTASIVSLGRPAPGTLGDERTAYEGWDLDFPYSRAKFHSREIAESFAQWGLDVRVVCPGMIFGPGDIAPTPSGKLILEMLKSNTPPIYVDGGASFVDVRDAAEVHALVAEKGRAGERYLATAHNLNNYEFLMSACRALGVSRKYYKLPLPAARAVVAAMELQAKRTGKEPPLSRVFFEYSLKPSFYDNRKSVQELGATYRDVETSIRDAVAWFREHGMA
ncbi:MAG: NAD-dependent epimerase/dehydratase family protein [Sandaracinus sp.]|nr:NAD-dependent epimerase/dehydratase family protein [Myxococcales bacterium]MCB9624364.1 NAD-dependent epimerase/dehydratase family protein [Sandaracinus sp.]MCB9634290.1 NAD-dependent epimerase/dehydratase family protein [Sandaracinus sp.]